MDLPRLIEALSDPDAYPYAVKEVEAGQTGRKGHRMCRLLPGHARPPRPARWLSTPVL
jgi:hypothetical protein